MKHKQLYLFAIGLCLLVLTYFLMPPLRQAINQMYSLLFYQDEKGIRMLVVSYQALDWLVAAGIVVMQTILFPFSQKLVSNANMNIFNWLGGPMFTTLGFIIGASCGYGVAKLIKLYLGKFHPPYLWEIDYTLKNVYPWIVLLLGMYWFIPFFWLGLLSGFSSLVYKKFSLYLFCGLCIHYYLLNL